MLPWRTLHIGGLSKPALLARLHAANVRLNPLAESLFADARFVTAPTPSLVDTMQLTVADLGLPDGGTFAELVAQATARSLALCPLELAPHLRLAWDDQPEGSAGQPPSQHCAPPGAVTVASAALDDDDTLPKGFYLRRIDGVLWLRGYCSWDGHVWRGRDVFVFLRGTRG